MNAQVKNAVVKGLNRDATTSDGTAVPQIIKDAGVLAIRAAWSAHKALVSVSGAILDMAKKCVDAARGDEKLAHAMFTSALADAETVLRMEHKGSKAEKQEVEDFLDSTSSWKQYTSNIGAAIKEGFDVRKAKTESQLRKMRRDAKELKNSESKAKKELGKSFDLAGVDETQLKEAIEEATSDKGVIDIDALKEVLEELDVPKAKQTTADLHKQAETDAARYIPGEGMDKQRSALAVVLKAVSVINMAEHGDRVANLLNQCIVGLNKLVPAEGTETVSEVKEAAQEAKTQAKEPQQRVGTI